ncbi:MAG: hypothetical protein MJZ01_08285 [Bacteroidales bacterium]|nr:hypothetical protein [Bacteroidales bacterium]
MKRYYLIIMTLLLVGCSEIVNYQPSDKMPDIYPDYVGVTIPVGIAPLNFNMADDDVDRMTVTLSNSHGDSYSVNSTFAEFEVEKWHQIVAKTKGDTLWVEVGARKSGSWTKYRPFHICVSADTLADRGITYRRLAPTFNINSIYMGLYCRDLANFDEQTVIDNKLSDQMCINCHIQNQTSTKDMMVHIRGSLAGTYIKHNGVEELIDTRLDSLLSVCVYNAWHPSGKFIAFSVNGTRQSFHVGGKKRIEVYDKGSDMVVYDVENHVIIRQPVLMTGMCETYPSFSPDGKWLYYCSSLRPENDECEEFKYDINRIAFDIEKGCVYGDIETVVEASKDGRNASFPRISPDGKYMMYSISDYGTFPIHHPEADLRMLNMATMAVDSMTIVNSDDAESYHNWSADSRWFVFCSRRDDGMHTRLYIGHVDSDGHCDKPFMLPQKNPKRYYMELFQSYNTPDFCDDMVAIDHRWLLGNLKKGARKIELK